MIGGMIWPPVEATASTAPANSGRKPVRFIKRNADLAGDHDIGHRRTGNGAEQARRHHRHFAGTAGVMAGETGRKVHEQLAGAGALHEGAEHHEDQHIGRRHRQRNSEDAFGGHVKLIEHALRFDLGNHQPVEQEHDRP